MADRPYRSEAVLRLELATLLERLERKGYVKSRVGNPTPERGGRAKRYFWIDAAGRTALAETREAIARMGGLVHAG
jgi:DNA-binding PadR family transcriptional regulator